MLEVSNVIYDYPGHRALKDVSFSIADGSITALVGPNGAGKSTLLRICAALDRPLAGKVLLEGADIHENARAAHERMGYLPDFFGLYDELTVAQCLSYRAAALGVAPELRPSRIAAASERTRIADRMKEKAGTLSRGLRQRLAIAQAIVHEPKLLILDEPAAGLDPEARMDLAAMLRELRDLGMTIIVSSHILAELEDYSTHMLVIRDGSILDHRPIGHGTMGMIWVRVELEAPDARLEAALRIDSGVSSLSVEGAIARFAMKHDRAPRVALLKRLVGDGFAITAFAVEQKSLQDAYLEQVRGVPPKSAEVRIS